MNSPPFDTVEILLFDLGGVVLDIDFTRVGRYWATQAGIAPDQISAKALEVDYARHERGEIESSAYLDGIRRLLGLQLDDRQMLAGWNALFIGVVPGMPALLNAAASRYPLYLFTNTNNAHRQFWQIHYAAVLRLFEELFISCEMGLRKPDAQAFTFIANRLGRDFHQILFFDDSPENIEVAQNLGMPAVLVQSIDDVRKTLMRLGIN